MSVRHHAFALGLLVAAGACAPTAPTAVPDRSAVAAVAAAPMGDEWQIGKVDPSVGACEDFYQHVCGPWIASATVPAGKGELRWVEERSSAVHEGAMQRLLAGKDSEPDPELGRVRAFYASCMADGPQVDSAGQRTLAGWMDRLAKISSREQVQAMQRDLAVYGVGAFFQYAGVAARTDRARHRGEIHQGSTGLETSEYAAIGADATVLHKGYVEHLRRMFELAGMSPADAQRDADTTFQIESKLAAASISLGDYYDPQLSEHSTTAEGLKDMAPLVEWAPYLALVGHREGRPVNVTSPAYLIAVNEVLATRPIEALRAYLRWQLLDAWGGALPKPLADEHARFYAQAGSGRPSRGEQCRIATIRALGVELSRQYARRALEPTVRDRAREVAQEIRGELMRAAGAEKWLSPQARAAAEEKMELLDLKIGYPDVWPEVGTFPIQPNAYLENVLAARSFEQHRDWARARTARRKDSWEMIVLPWEGVGMAAARLMIRNGFPDQTSNSIIVMAARIQAPQFLAAAPLEVRYGGFGSFIGHELGHSMEAHQFDARGELRDHWSKEDTKSHAARRKCLVDQANEYEVFGLHLDGKNTIDENVADLTGVVHAYSAMARQLGRRVDERGADNLTPAQRFFIAYAQGWCAAERPEYAKDKLRADPHGPARFRVNGPLSNMPEFGQAFGCAEGTRMARPAAARCQVW